MGSVFVIAEHQKGLISDITFEMLGIGKEIAEKTGNELITILLGNNCRALADSFGISNKVLYIDHELLTEVTSDAYIEALTNIFGQYPPEVIFTSSNNLHWGIGSLLAQKLNFPFIKCFTYDASIASYFL